MKMRAGPIEKPIIGVGPIPSFESGLGVCAVGIFEFSLFN